jgi:hypothetical protein
VHSIPPALWFSELAKGFDNTPDNREILAVWVQIGNFYFARLIGIIILATGAQPPPGILAYTQRHSQIFSSKSLQEDPYR